MFFPGKPFQPSLMLTGKAGVYLSGAQKLHSRVGSWPYPQTLEKNAKPGQAPQLVTIVLKLQA